MRSKTLIGDGFSVIFGDNRGLNAHARIQLEIDERSRLDSARVRAIEGLAHASERACGSRLVVDNLVRLWNEGVNTRTHENIFVARALERVHAQANDIRELVAVIAYGEVPLAPGLTAPAVLALTKYFEVESLTKEQQILEQWNKVLSECFQKRESDANDYSRLQGLAAALSAFIMQTRALGECWQEVKALERRMAEILKAAPTPALIGSLSSWVDHFKYLYIFRTIYAKDVDTLASAASAAGRAGDEQRRRIFNSIVHDL